MKKFGLVIVNTLTIELRSIIMMIAALSIAFSTAVNSQVLSNSSVKHIDKAQELMSENDYVSAEEKLVTFLNRGRLKNYDRAKALQLLAIIYLNIDKDDLAIVKIEEALSLDALETISASQLRQNLFSLYAMSEEYDKAIEHLKIWFANRESPTIQNYFLAGRVFGLSGNWQQASSYVEKGYLLLSEDKNLLPERSWLELTLTVRMQLSNYQEAKSLLEEMISLWPERYSYYQQLSGIYHRLKKEKESFAIISIAKQNNMISSKSELERLAQLYRYFENPYPAAVILKDLEMQESFKASEKYFESLANTWFQAREWTNAESALLQAASLSEDGKHWLGLCQSNFQRDSLKNAKLYCDKAIVKGGLGKQESVAWYLLALSKYRLDDQGGAKKAFVQCAKIEKNNESCERWLDVFAGRENQQLSEAPI